MGNDNDIFQQVFIRSLDFNKNRFNFCYLLLLESSKSILSSVRTETVGSASLTVKKHVSTIWHFGGMEGWLMSLGIRTCGRFRVHTTQQNWSQPFSHLRTRSTKLTSAAGVRLPYRFVEF